MYLYVQSCHTYIHTYILLCDPENGVKLSVVTVRQHKYTSVAHACFTLLQKREKCVVIFNSVTMFRELNCMASHQEKV